ncbi:alpha/beta fold hydrolase [Antrihabitans stalactiti]|jgi:pimeloyl-ACP methyl ester carboxylesterase|uniref:Alpha/beta hydrolase n=1 Tax=Antrihabitans stalactiti TaxID=2584121 RepID=A0A848K7P2_9NOCA|nr:alpha/beta hydrolase [Antrihabitans stalactiti]NMN94379.1 alpha/beta hydrolase [Antrihabitans stalactiti]
MSVGNDVATPVRVTFRGTGGIELVGDAWGATDAPLVLMLHGGGQTRHSWKSTGAALAANGLRVVALDARGHGESEWAPDGDYRRATLAADVEAVLDQLGAPAIVVGASMGGLTSLIMSTRVGPDRLTGIVLVDVVPRPEEAGVSRVIDFLRAHHEGFATLDEAADAIAAYLPHRPRPSATDGLARNLRRREDGRWYWHWDPEMIADRGEIMEDAVLELEAAARELTIPVLLVRGKLSDVVSESNVDEFRALVPHAEFVELSGAAHTAAADDNDAFTDAVCDFVLANAARAR